MDEKPTSCEKIRERFELSDMRLLHLDEQESTAIQQHTRDCAGCRQWISDWELIKFGTKALPMESVPDMVLTNVMAAIEPEAQMSSSHDLVFMISAFCVFLGALWLYSPEVMPEVVGWSCSLLMILGLHYVNTNIKTPLLQQ